MAWSGTKQAMGYETRTLTMKAFPLLLSLLTVLGISGCKDRNIGKPNVIIIMTDDQGYGDMSCNGHPILETPNIDRLRNEGVHFSDFHVSPYCAPTRASLMTGRDSRRVGVWNTYGGKNWLNEEETVLAEIFKANNYATGHFGKWHLGDNYPFAPHFRGFDVSFMLGNSGLGATDDYWGNDRFDDTYFLNGKPVKTSGFCTDVFVDRTLDFIREHKEGPFFVYLATNVPHQPWNIPNKYREKYDPDATDTREVVHYVQRDMARFYGTIDKIDEQVGRVLDYLDQEGLAENTIVLFLTDNGTVSLEYNAGMQGRKGSEYEGGHRVPLFLRWPGGKLAPGRGIDELTTHMDIAPTLIDLCGLSMEKEIIFDGQSIYPLLYGREGDWNRDRIYVTQFTQPLPGKYHNSPPKHGRTVICKEKWRLVNDELYNIFDDPAQESNVAGANPEIVKELIARFEEYWGDIYPNTRRIARVRIGNENMPLTTLSLAGVTPPQGQPGQWSMAGAIDAEEINGIFPLYVETPGYYSIELRRWPAETGKAIEAYEGMGGRVPIREFKEDAVRIVPERARIRIGALEKTAPVDPEAQAVNFEVELDIGATDLQTWFIDADGTERTAYWIYIHKTQAE